MTGKKCTKYEELFISDDENALMEHIKTCPDCKTEYENMQKVSGLIKEVSFVYRRKKQTRTKILATAATFFVAFLAFFAIQFSNPTSYVNETIAYISDSDYTYEQMGLPVDDYGFIMVDFED